MGLLDFFKKKKTEVTITEEDRKQFAEGMKANAEALVRQFEDENLDYSVCSLETLDSILDESTYFYQEADDETKRKMIIKGGSYVFEVARKNFGGKYYWYDRLDQPILVTGQPDFEMSLLAYEKVRGRFENGHEDNIPFFFAGYVEGVNERATRMIV